MTRLGEAEDALLVLLQAAFAAEDLDNGPQLWEPQDPGPESVWIAEEALATRAASQTGNTPEYREEFDLRVVVDVVRTARDVDFVELRDRGVALVAIVEQVCVDQPRFGTGSPGGSRIWHAEVRSVERFSAAEDDKRGVRHVVGVHVVAYLRGGP